MEYKNAKYISETTIDCEINHPVHGWLPYTCSNADTDKTAIARNISLRADMEENDDVEAWVAPTASEIAAALTIDIRMERDYLLSNVVDPIVSNPLRWASFSEAKQSEWTVYRQALLDLTDQSGFPEVYAWPERPS